MIKLLLSAPAIFALTLAAAPLADASSQETFETKTVSNAPSNISQTDKTVSLDVFPTRSDGSLDISPSDISAMGKTSSLGSAYFQNAASYQTRVELAATYDAPLESSGQLEIGVLSSGNSPRLDRTAGYPNTVFIPPARVDVGTGFKASF